MHFCNTLNMYTESRAVATGARAQGKLHLIDLAGSERCAPQTSARASVACVYTSLVPVSRVCADNTRCVVACVYTTLVAVLRVCF